MWSIRHTLKFELFGGDLNKRTGEINHYSCIQETKPTSSSSVGVDEAVVAAVVDEEAVVEDRRPDRAIDNVDG